MEVEWKVNKIKIRYSKLFETGKCQTNRFSNSHNNKINYLKKLIIYQLLEYTFLNISNEKNSAFFFQNQSYIYKM